jgi:ribosomal protein S18 acetylase RimI-like enzyme
MSFDTTTTPEILSVEITEYQDSDKDALIAGIVDLQEVERMLTDTRRPGGEVAEAYVAGLLEDVSQQQGKIFVARDGSTVAGFVACWVEREDNVAETTDSNVYGYIPDAYVAPEYRGRGVFQKLNAKAEEYLRSLPEVTRIRITVLASNAQALAAYRKAGYGDYEIMLEKLVPKLP